MHNTMQCISWCSAVMASVKIYVGQDVATEAALRKISHGCIAELPPKIPQPATCLGLEVKCKCSENDFSYLVCSQFEY